MNSLTAHRQALVALLTGAGLRATGHLPERPTPPIVTVSAGAPYLTAGDTFGTFTHHWTLVALTAVKASEVMTAELDDMIARILVAVTGSDFGIDTVDQPLTFQVNNATYLGVTIDVSITGPVEDGA